MGTMIISRCQDVDRELAQPCGCQRMRLNTKTTSFLSMSRVVLTFISKHYDKGENSMRSVKNCGLQTSLALNTSQNHTSSQSPVSTKAYCDTTFKLSLALAHAARTHDAAWWLQTWLRVSKQVVLRSDIERCTYIRLKPNQWYDQVEHVNTSTWS